MITIILLAILLINQVIFFLNLKNKIMSAENKLDELLASISDVITLIENAFTGTGDLTESEVEEKVTPILERLRAIVPPPVE